MGVGSSRVISRQTMERSLVRFHAKCVSAADAGDYYQVSFETEDPGDGLDGPISSFSDHDHGYVGHYRLKLIDFSPTQLVVAIERIATLMSR
jgi:hypothetical protein